MSQENIKFKIVCAKLVGSNVVNFRLEDGALLKIHVDIARVGVAIDRKGPDGSPLYTINISPRIEIEPKDKTFMAPPPPIPIQTISQPVNGKNPDKAYTS
jgi:hypothetical protein